MGEEYRNRRPLWQCRYSYPSSSVTGCISDEYRNRRPVRQCSYLNPGSSVTGCMSDEYRNRRLYGSVVI